MGYYDVAQICLNGHVVNDASKTRPQHNENFCERCGAKTITKCPNCNTDIRGEYISEGVVVLASSEPVAQKFCYNCGSPFPWTNEAIKAAHELAAEMENLSDDEKKILNKSIDEIVNETPKTELEATKFKKIMIKVGKETAEMFKNILVSIASETAKKIIWGS